MSSAIHLNDKRLTVNSYAFPGNVRELENILERTMTPCEGDTIRQRDLHLPKTTDNSFIPPCPAHWIPGKFASKNTSAKSRKVPS